LKETAMTTRQKPHHKVHQLFVDRWSPRAFDESAIPNEDLEAIFAAAGLAPSAFNYQPWKFLYARRGDANWERFLSLLIPFNASWAKDAGVLIFIVSDTKMRGPEDAKDHYSHSFDAGAAWAQMALQATLLGYHAHGMTGVDFPRAHEELGVPEGYRIEAAVAIGRRDAPERLPEGLREREVPSDRKPVAEIAIAGNFQ
jgi:nitroreductase